jgi:small-conductance mechanosensitive channel
MNWLERIDWNALTARETWVPATRVALILIVGFVLFRVLAALLARVLRKRSSEQVVMLVRKAVIYSGWVLVLLLVMSELGFNLTALLGAAGIAGIALGFASQTSVSNVISGVFLISERSFEVGDVITVEGQTGVVMSIDLLAVKLRTFNNQMVRIPNETMIKTLVVNVTRFPIRRLDLNIGVAYKEDVARVEAVLRDVAARNPLVLDEPAPTFIFRAFGDSALEILFGVWFVKSDWVPAMNSMMREVKERFDEEGIEIPFPHRTLYTGALTEPFPIRIVDGSPTVRPAPPPVRAGGEA